ncbi:hypothetical protein CYLTODRAFT_337816, partial [Cylindrobasidium torrendii FP15055 ss-10]
YSKIGKVMRHIAALTEDKLPTAIDEQYKFRQRSRVLVDRWQAVAKDKDSEPAKNGLS